MSERSDCPYLAACGGRKTYAFGEVLEVCAYPKCACPADYVAADKRWAEYLGVSGSSVDRKGNLRLYRARTFGPVSLDTQLAFHPAGEWLGFALNPAGMARVTLRSRLPT